MKTKIEEIKKHLERALEGFKDAYDNYGYDLANEKYDVKTALNKVNLLLLHDVSNCTLCNTEINYKGVCEMCYTEQKLNDID